MGFRYSAKDGWPPDSERNLILRTVGEASLSEEAISAILAFGLAPNVPLTAQAGLDILESLVRKAAHASLLGTSLLAINLSGTVEGRGVSREEQFGSERSGDHQQPPLLGHLPPAQLHRPAGRVPNSVSLSHDESLGFIGNSDTRRR